MDFSLLTFGELLHPLNSDLKNQIRNFEKQKNQILSAKYGILLNQTYIYIYIYICSLSGYIICHNIAQECIIIYFQWALGRLLCVNFMQEIIVGINMSYENTCY